MFNEQADVYLKTTVTYDESHRAIPTYNFRGEIQDYD